MKKSVVLVERPVRRAFDEAMRTQVGEILKARARESPVPLTARWHKDAPVLRIDSKFVSWEITFGPTVFKVEAFLTTLGLFLDNKKSRQEALDFVGVISGELGV